MELIDRDILSKEMCEKCGNDCGLNAFAITTEVIHNPCPVHLKDCGNLQITSDQSKIRYILCQDCYKGLGLPNVYSTIRDNRLFFRDITKNYGQSDIYIDNDV